MLSGCGGGLRRSRPGVGAKALARHGRGRRRRGAELRCVGPMWPRALASGAAWSLGRGCRRPSRACPGQAQRRLQTTRNKKQPVPVAHLVHLASYSFAQGGWRQTCTTARNKKQLVPSAQQVHGACTCCTLGTSCFLLTARILDTIDKWARRNKKQLVPSVQQVHLASLLINWASPRFGRQMSAKE